MRTVDIIDLVTVSGCNHGDQVSCEFMDEIEPVLLDMSQDERWLTAGMLLFWGSVAEARVATDYAANPLRWRRLAP